jgi:hypothetical protein
MPRTALSVVLLLCSTVVVTSFLHGRSQDDGPVSLIQLIANPEKYDGTHVLVVGFLRLEFEGNALYVHEDDYKNNIYGNAIGIGVTKKWKWSKEELNMHYVMLGGTFKAGKSNLHTGTIVDVTSVTVWPKRTPKK